MYNKEFQIINTEEKAYFLGQAFGDGCNQYLKDYKFTMASEISDENLYKQLQTLFPFLKLKYYKSHSNVVYLDCYEKQFSLDLLKLGLTQNKVLQDNKHNFNIPELPEHLLHHFIRGFFDADGSIWTPTRFRSRNNIRVEIGLGTKNFCLQLLDVLSKEGIKATYTSRYKKAGNGKRYLSYIINITSRKESLKFRDYIYKDASIYLQRKKEKFNIYVLSILQIKRNKFPLCPNCDNIPTSNGIRNGKQRLLCKHCNTHYSVTRLLL